MRIAPFLAAAVFLTGTLLPIPPEARGLTDEEKKSAFLESQGRTNSSSEKNSTPEPSESKSPAKPRKHKPKPKAARKKRHRHPVQEETPHHKVQPTPQPTPEPKETPEPTPHLPQNGPTPQQNSPHPGPTVSPEQKPSPNAVIVEKSGAQEDEATPSPTPEPAHGWSWWPFGHAAHYKYLTRAVRDAIDKAPVARHRWRYIVVHNSGTRQGNAKAFDYYHLHVRKMPNGLAYHFVIGNGTSSGNGAVEIGGRWTRQINGGHVHSDFLNNIALGICLVGDFNHDKPTPQQLEALDELIRYLRSRVGKTDHKLATIKAHKDINPPQWPTDCPGENFPYRWLYTRFD